MLHTPTTETKQRNSDAGLASPRPAEPELSPFVGGFEAPRQPKSPGPFSSYDAVSRYPHLAQLHRTYGNNAILRTMNQSLPPSPSGTLQRKCACGGAGPGACDACRDRDNQTRRTASLRAGCGTMQTILSSEATISRQLALGREAVQQRNT